MNLPRAPEYKPVLLVPCIMPLQQGLDWPSSIDEALLECHAPNEGILAEK